MSYLVDRSRTTATGNHHKRSHKDPRYIRRASMRAAVTSTPFAHPTRVVASTSVTHHSVGYTCVLVRFRRRTHIVDARFGILTVFAQDKFLQYDVSGLRLAPEGINQNVESQKQLGPHQPASIVRQQSTTSAFCVLQAVRHRASLVMHKLLPAHLGSVASTEVSDSEVTKERQVKLMRGLAKFRRLIAWAHSS